MKEVIPVLKKYRKTLILASVITILPVIVGIVFWNRLPDLMATHFDFNNQANGFSGKAFAVFGIPLLLLAIFWIGAVVTLHDPRRQNISPKLLTLCLWIVPVVSLICAAAIYPYNLGIPMNLTFYMELLTGFLFIVIGNYLPKTRQNYTVGIKVPWTLANEENWNRTHRLGGYLWVIGGVLLILLTFTGLLNSVLMVGIILLLAIVPCIYSFWLHTAKGL